MTEEESFYWLCQIPGIYRRKLKKLIALYQSPKHIYEMAKKEIRNISILTEEEQNALIIAKDSGEILENYHKLQEQKIKFISCNHPKYPARLRSIPDYPICLYIKGNLPQDKPSVAIVGARNCSNYGKEIALSFAREMARNDILIISGLARGIDEYGHRGALLAGGETVGVLGCGVNVVYPRENKQLYEEMLQRGGVISEYGVQTQPRPMFFPERNRIISGLADIIIVVEAREKSGSLITADFALEQGRDVFAVSGRVTDELSKGCNWLISQGASILYSPFQVMEELGIKYEKNEKLLKKSNNLLERKENMLYSGLDLNPKSLEEILYSVDLTYSEIMMTLVDLEIKGLIRETSKNYYVRIEQQP
ncbi:DNA-processing protein DprA [Konateibacter massiliensis]|uniref:DNA-processing protein DprA n=1 Tax=Konateibacter massiliensis TaxID=2002841 RepID=UPI000C150391|nr:DNA-processing protein DprA [Konateibacter massiliensis]